MIGVIATQEHLVLRLAEHLRAQLIAHAQARDHLACHLGCALQVVARAGRDIRAHELLGNAAAQEHGELVEHLAARLEEMVLGGQLHGVAERLAAADDRDLVHGIGVVQDVPDQRVAAFVIGDRGPLGLAHHATLALWARHHTLHRLLDLVHGDERAPTASGEQSCLVEQVGQVCAGKAHGELRELFKAHVGVERLVCGVHAQDLLSAAHVGAIDRDLTVKAARAQQSGVEDIGAVGRRDENHALVLLKAVHLHEQLVERLLALVVASAQTGAALTAHGIDLVDEDDRRRLFLGALEQVAHARRAHAHEHLDELRAGNREERHARLAGHGLGQQRLAGARRTDQQHAARNLSAELAEALGIREEVADLLELLDRLVNAGDVLELDVRARGGVGLGVGLAELHGLVVGAHHLAHEVDHGDQDNRRRQNAQDQIEQ